MQARSWVVSVAFGCAACSLLVSLRYGHGPVPLPRPHRPALPSTSPATAVAARDPLLPPVAPTRLDLARAVEAFGAALETGDTPGVQQARQACLAFGKTVLPAMGAYLGTPRPTAVQVGFVRYLRDWRERAAFEALETLISHLAPDPGGELRLEVARALPICGGHGALTKLLALLTAPEWRSARPTLVAGIVAVAYPGDAAAIEAALDQPEFAPIRTQIRADLDRRAQDLARDPSSSQPGDAAPEAARWGIAAVEQRAARGDPHALSQIMEALSGPTAATDPTARANLYAALVRLRREPAAREAACRVIAPDTVGALPEPDRIALAEALAHFGAAEDRPIMDRLAQPRSSRIEEARRFFAARIAAQPPPAR